MKKTYFSLFAGIAILILGVILLVEWYTNSNSLQTQGTELEFDNIGYDVKYDDLLNRRTGAWISLLGEKIPERTCFSVEQNQIIQKNFFQSDLYLDPELHTWVDKSDSRFSDYTESISITNSEALEILSKYRFEMEEKTTQNNQLKLEDHSYRFICFFEYQENQYELEIAFDPIYPDTTELVFVNIAKNEANQITLSQDDLYLIRGKFNNSVIFQNHLDEDIRLFINGPDQREIPLKNTTYEFLIPDGKPHSFYFNNIMSGGIPLNYTYHIQPYGLGGNVTAVFPNFNCLTQEEVEDFYNMGLNSIELPKYLPENYHFKCGQGIINFAVKLYYWNDALGEFDKSQDLSRPDMFVGKGGLTISYTNERMNDFHSDEPYEKLSKAESSCKRENCKVLRINDNYAVLPENSSQLTLFTDNNSYKISINYPNRDELVKIASSIETG